MLRHSEHPPLSFQPAAEDGWFYLYVPINFVAPLADRGISREDFHSGRGLFLQMELIEALEEHDNWIGIQLRSLFGPAAVGLQITENMKFSAILLLPSKPALETVQEHGVPGYTKPLREVNRLTEWEDVPGDPPNWHPAHASLWNLLQPIYSQIEADGKLPPTRKVTV